jgi:hypothetical protein
LSFDSLTTWPPPALLPEGFDPAAILEAGYSPGLGVRKLHESGIDGRGIGLAIIDQPLLREHVEYKDAFAKYEAVEVEGVPPQMHGPAVASIAVGKTCGVAPGASLYYFAVPMWKWLEDTPWSELLERIVALNQTLKDTPKIRVVSISLGAFSERPNLARWQEAVRKANEAGVLVVTCDPTFLHLGTLKRKENRRGEEPDDYERGRYSAPMAELYAPAGNRAIASPQGAKVFTYDRTGGMSWTVPYLAGLAALAWQVEPGLRPDQVVQLWRQTAVKTSVGPVVNPAGFIAAVKLRQ